MNDTAPVLGQDDELSALDAFLDGIRDGPGAAVLHGDIGAGKTTLWRAVIASAATRGYRILMSHPSESEASLAFASLGDLLEGVLDDIGDEIASPQLRAVRIATLLEDPRGSEPDLRAVAVGTLAVVRALARRSPIVVGVDDYQWTDQATARVLRFISRRLETEPVAFVLAGRGDERGGTQSGRGDPSALLEGNVAARRMLSIRPAPLGPDAFDALFRSQLGESFPPPMLREIATASGGNPLFGLEIARGVQRGDLRPQPGQRVPVPRTLEDLVAARLAQLPENVRELLWHAAAVSEPTVALLEATAPAAGVRAALELAARTDVVGVRGGRVTFTHPLFASTLYHGVPAARRRALHSQLASLVSGPLERARHLALSVTRPDSSVAAALSDAARAAAGRGAPDSAATFSEQAWRITPNDEPGERRERRLEAAGYHLTSGDTGRARQILEETLAELDAGPPRATVLRRLAEVRYRTDSAAIAAQLLTRALEEAGPDPSQRGAIERDLAWAVTMCGDVRDAVEHARSARALVEGAGDDALLPEVLAVNGMTEFLAGGGMQPDLMRRSVELARSGSDVPIEWRPRTMLAVMLKWSDAVPEARERLGMLVAETTEAADETSLPYLLAQLSEVETWMGDWDSALAHAEQADRLALQTGQDAIRATVLYAKSLVQAHLGSVDAGRSAAREAFALAERSGSVISMMQAQSVLGFLDLSLDDPAGADALLAPLETWLDVVGIREPGVLRFVPDAVEALIALGRLEKAEAILLPFEADATRLGRRWAMLASARVRALHLTAAGDAAAGATLLAEALAMVGDTAQPFARGRTMLALGTIQRRTRRRRAARDSLAEALELFEGLGARLWAAKAARMLGGDTRAVRPADAARLTPAETRVAELVASGATNQAVADRLFVSVRAVEAHLTSIYRKLGVRSRSRLAVMMAAQDGPALQQRPGGSRGP